jgi:hypothetical protein
MRLNAGLFFLAPRSGERIEVRGVLLSVAGVKTCWEGWCHASEAIKKASLTLALSLPRRARGKTRLAPGVAFFFLARRSGERTEVRNLVSPV